MKIVFDHEKLDVYREAIDFCALDYDYEHEHEKE